MRRSNRLASLIAVGGLGLLAAGAGVASASTAPPGTDGAAAAPSGPARVGVILPDTASSDRWETADRPFLAEAFEAAGVEYDIQNAEGDAANMATIADQMLANGATVLMIVNLDSDSGAQIQQVAADAGVPTIDYDRLTLGSSASVYVSFDNVQVGVLQGEGLVQCLADAEVENPAIAVLNGSPTDNNATLFAEGYNSVIEPLFDDGSFTLVDDQSVPDWNNEQGGQIFEQMLTAANGEIDGVVAANDGLAGAVVTVLQANNLQLPVTGQDATVDGLRRILQGDQCMTVYKAVRTEAEAAAAAAIALANGEEPETTGTVLDGDREVPAVLATPVAIYAENVNDVVADGYQTYADVCTGIEDLCEEYGVVDPGTGTGSEAAGSEAAGTEAMGTEAMGTEAMGTEAAGTDAATATTTG